MADEEKKSSSSTIKIVATIFGAVIAPLVVGVGIKWADPAFWKPTQPHVQNAPATQPPPAPPPTAPRKGPGGGVRHPKK